jgi:hypothetical protein
VGNRNEMKRTMHLQTIVEYVTGTILMEKRIEDITGTFIHAGKG